MAIQAEGPEEGRVQDSQSHAGMYVNQIYTVGQEEADDGRRLKMSTGTMVMEFQLGGKPA